MKKQTKKKEFKYYTKVRINETILYFDTFEKLYLFIDLFFKANKNNEFIETAQSCEGEFLLNTEE